ncbi:hypothetical protein [Kribbella sp. NPDC004875]|uniref:hypothetical protein n=1 Tax=Kribbella sp. NPDC004875 TaxID=3364107 RepID=UPI0036B03ED7
MTDQDPASTVPDDVAQAGRVRLAEWLTAESSEPGNATSPEDLAEWAAYQAEEFLVFVPPGYSNLMFLVADHGISSFQPSLQSLDQAMIAARAQS